jgi:hypothetical protein
MNKDYLKNQFHFSVVNLIILESYPDQHLVYIYYSMVLKIMKFLSIILLIYISIKDTAN